MKILIVVDMQNDFITGSLGTPEAQAIVPNVKKKIKQAFANEDLVIYTRDTHYEDYLDTAEGKKLPVKHCISGTEGWHIPQELLPADPYAEYWVQDKPTFGLYELPQRLRNRFGEDFLNKNITEIELLGLCTDICVVSNALLMKSYFYDMCEISVDATCCAGVTPESHEAALKTMEMCQINVKR